MKIADANAVIQIGTVGLHVETDEIKSDCLWAIHYATDNHDDNLSFLV